MSNSEKAVKFASDLHVGKLVQKWKPKLATCPYQRMTIRDKEQPGLMLLIGLAAASYAVQFSKRRRVVGKVSDYKLDQVRDLVRPWRQLMADGGDPADERKAKREAERQARLAAREKEKADREAARVKVAGSVDATIERFIERHVAKLKTAHRMGGYLRTVAKAWRGRMVAEITRRDVRDLVDKLEDRPASRDLALAFITSYLEWCLNEDLVPANVARGIKRIRSETENARDVILDDRQLKAVWQASERLDLAHHRAVVQLMILTGQRRSEIAGLTWDDIDWQGMTFKIDAARYKTGRAMTIPMTPLVAQILRGLEKTRGGGKYVMSGRGRKPFSTFSAMKEEIEQNIITPMPDGGWCWHDLRRTLRSGLSRLGVRPDIGERVIGHTVGNTISRTYDRFDYMQEKRDALLKWEAHLIGAGVAPEPVVIQLKRA